MMTYPENAGAEPARAAAPTRGWRRKFLAGALATGLLAFILDVEVAGSMVAPHQSASPWPNVANYPVETVRFSSTSGATIKGWVVPAQKSRGVLILMHGVIASRLAMLDRVGFLHDAGYSVLLFDFQAHGESIGKHITFGYLESRDATAAVEFARQKFPGQKIAVLGVSMGGAAALLAHPPLPVDAMIVESVYPTIKQAIGDRLVIRFGPLGKLAEPLLTWQMKPRLGFGVEDLRPIDRVPGITVPKFFIAGDADRDTTLKESQALFAAAAEPKQLWIVPGAVHEDLHRYARQTYEKKVLAFLGQHLN